MDTNSNKYRLLKDLYDTITEISVFTVKSFEAFYNENQNKSEHELAKLLRVAKQAINFANSRK